MFIPLCICDTPYLLKSYPTDSGILSTPHINGPCIDPIKTLTFLKGDDEESLNHTECIHDSNNAILTCKLGIGNVASSLNLDKYPLNDINILILFVQQFPKQGFSSRVLDLCFINRFSKSLQELAICGYQPPITESSKNKYLHILDIPALAIVASNIQTLLISGVNIWQSIELRQFYSLKHLLVIQGSTIQMQYYHSPHCADCEGTHPQLAYSFHYLIPLSSQLTYYLFESNYDYGACQYDLLKKIQSNPLSISTFIVVSRQYKEEESKPICETCESGLCPLLAVCLDPNSKERRNPNKPFECLCVEELAVEDEFISCEPMTVHPPMYSTRCYHTPSFLNYVTLPMIILASYISLSIIVFICSTIFLIISK